MIKGMTGFGKTAVAFPRGRIAVEARSINGRYFDLVLHLPENFNVFEERIRQEVKKQIKRGRITLSLLVSSNQAPSVYLNKGLARNYFIQLKRLSQDLKLNSPIALQDFVRLDGVLSLAGAGQPAESIWLPTKKAVGLALNKLVKMRKAEGISTYIDINNKLKRLGNFAMAISQRRAIIFSVKKKQLLPEEWYCFAKNRDINEETQRLKFQLQNFKKYLRQTDPVGKELDFISQELQREINTIGAKLPDQKITSLVIKIKGLIEQIREQLQNIE